MKASIVALIMVGLLAAVIVIVVIAVTASKSPASSTVQPSRRLGSLVQPVPHQRASGYT